MSSSDLEKTDAHTAALAANAQNEHVDQTDDVAAVFLAKVAAENPEFLADWTPAEERKLLRRKIDPILMTLCQFALMMGAVDKVCVGTAAVLGMRTDLNLIGQRYSWVSSMLYFGAIAAVFPTLWIMQHFSTGKWLSFNCAVWGIILMTSAATQSYAGLLVARFVLGLFEACIFAGFGLIVAAWWKKSEQPWRTSVIFSTLSSVMNGILSYAAASYTGSLGQWRVLFLSVGAVTFAWAVLCWFFLPDGPTKAKWLTTREKVIAVRRVRNNNTGIENKIFKFSQFKEALLDPKTWFFFLINLALNVANGGILGFNSIVVATLGFTIKQTVLLAIPTGVISWISSIVFSYFAVKSGKRLLIAMVSCIPPFIGAIVLYIVPRTNQGGSLAGLYLVFCYWGPYIVMSTIMYANTAGYTKKTAVYAIAYIGYCIGNLIGPQTFIAKQAPKYSGAIAAFLACYSFAICAMALFWVYLNAQNKKKAKQLAAYIEKYGEKQELLEDWRDETDLENPRFVYII